ncbi:kinetochore-associated Ndc80 complex subunit spc25 [Tieghemiomyces parasiticus]|uniref:Kinetochore protein SPC25 n=1 Tax=Tieghemiomyces parasiticus TaxID=78921 RepID=A0A9W8AGT9_9FUNG|nr:kinetochore-associated Ndc80 complex subunit spc25 [Tieghemiomyces parasiticus]
MTAEVNFQEVTSQFAHVAISDPTFPYDEIKDSMATFLKQFDAFVNQRKQEFSEKHMQWQKTRSENKEHYKSLHGKIDVFSHKHDELRKTLKRETQAEEALRSAISELNVKREAIERNRDLLETQAETLRREIKSRKEAIAAREKEILLQQSRNEPELQYFRSKLAMTIYTLPANLLEFTFTQINEKNLSQPFRFVIDANAREYQGTAALDLKYT